MSNYITTNFLSPVGAKLLAKDKDGNRGVVNLGAGQHTLDIIGNSIASSSAIFTTSDIISQYATSIAANLCAAMGQSIRVGRTFATGGVTSDYIVSTHLPQFIASASKYGLFVCFENDILGISLAQSITNAETIMRECKKHGKKCVFMAPLPSFSYTTTASRDAYYGLCNALVKLCELYGFYFCNSFNLYGNYASAYPQPLSGYTDASVHPNASTVINKIVNQGLLPIFSKLIPTSKKFYSGGSSPYNGVTNPNFNGTAGTLGTGASGVIPTSWVGNAYGAGNSGVFSVAASSDNDDVAPWFQGVYSGSTPSTLVMASGNFALSGSLFAVGDTVEATMEMEVVAGGAGCGNLDLWVIFNGGGLTVYSNVESVNNLTDNPGRLMLRSPAVVIPVGTTSMTIYGRFRSFGTFNFTGRIRHPAIVKS